MNFTNQIFKLMQGKKGQQFYRLFSGKKGRRSRGWTLLLYSGIGAAIGIMMRNNQSMMKFIQPFIGGRQTRNTGQAPFHLNKVLTTEMAEEFLEKGTSQNTPKKNG